MTGRHDGGSASVLLLTLGLAIVILGTAIASAGSMLLADQRAGAAADLSALTAARAALRGQDAACAAARIVAGLNGAHLRSCRIDGLDAVVTVRAAVPVTVPGGRDTVTETARAGPVGL
ncbi:MAG: Rv3654c family TadE-like protein [Mycobacteriales bacterium]